MLGMNTRIKSDWCPGCGNFGIIAGLRKAVEELGVSSDDLVLVSGVGCYAKLPYWVNARGFVGLHGRELAVGQGMKLANNKLKVVVFSGDGAGYGEGGNHFIHACRRGVDVTYIVHNNGVFGLTTGQYSPTSEKGRKSKSSPTGSSEQALNPLAVAIASGAGFVARAYTGDLKQMAEIFSRALKHKGFAFVDVVQSCISFGREEREKICYLDSGFDKFNKIQAMEKAWEADKGEKIACGVFYEVRM